MNLRKRRGLLLTNNVPAQTPARPGITAFRDCPGGPGYSAAKAQRRFKCIRTWKYRGGNSRGLKYGPDRA